MEVSEGPPETARLLIFVRPLIHFRSGPMASLATWSFVRPVRPDSGLKSFTFSALRVNTVSFLSPATGAMDVSSSLFSMFSVRSSGTAAQTFCRSTSLTLFRVRASFVMSAPFRACTAASSAPSLMVNLLPDCLNEGAA